MELNKFWNRKVLTENTKQHKCQKTEPKNTIIYKKSRVEHPTIISNDINYIQPTLWNHVSNKSVVKKQSAYL